MSDLVALIVLSYLLVIALCVTLWSAVSLRRASSPPDASEPGGSRAGASATHAAAGRHEPRKRTHDAYRGAGATPASEVHVRDVGTTRPTVKASRTDPDRSAAKRDDVKEPQEQHEPTRRRNEDAFERFLRADDDY